MRTFELYGAVTARAKKLELGKVWFPCNAICLGAGAGAATGAGAGGATGAGAATGGGGGGGFLGTNPVMRRCCGSPATTSRRTPSAPPARFKVV